MVLYWLYNYMLYMLKFGYYILTCFAPGEQVAGGIVTSYRYYDYYYYYHQ